MSEQASEALDEQSRWLLVSDVDQTLTGDLAALHQFIEVTERTPNLLVCLNSSRPAASVAKTLVEIGRPFKPDALITAMGTEIRLHGEELSAWSRQFAGWDRRLVDDVMRELGYRPHRAELQTRWKASFIVPRGEDQRRAAEALDGTGIGVCIVVSGESDFDVMPPGAGKDRAALFLSRHLHLKLDRMIVAGDSRNDLSMFEVARRGIVVGNARHELRDAVTDWPGVYVAQAAYAAGVLEGLRHWGVVEGGEPTSVVLSESKRNRLSRG
ncbi:MAG: HAD-IIB family hydrolase [Phycisphaeraceae bacterium]